MTPLLLSLLLAGGLLVGVAPRATPPAAAAEADASFTVVVLPDLQGYTVSSTYAATATAQTQWIADQADDLDVAVVAQVGDLVETHPIPEQWTRASTSMKVLDDAGVPSAVLPGNHDMDVSTGEAVRYDASFPASRYTGASWNGPAATYVEGYRGNKNSAVTFERSGMDFMLLSLEYDPTDAVLAWARGVLAAHPEHRVILSTHSFIHTAGGRSTTTTRTDAGANTPQQVWDELVQPSCQIFLVVNGHWHDGPDRTEARRADANACGRPVQQILSDYQDRPNGGDGWLRTYRFDPAADTITAATYSPTLARYETDADSAFTLAYDMTSGTTPPPMTTPTTLVGPGSAWT
ncbi:metallophosphoesterase, partial [Aeromicrobium sp. Leaf272]|uniref:metallophosphoesterase n=1 Tax=Aeromicrobium sp. Leaf272 TaxID=1736317 RepID=UPI00191064CE